MTSFKASVNALPPPTPPNISREPTMLKPRTKTVDEDDHLGDSYPSSTPLPPQAAPLGDTHPGSSRTLGSMSPRHKAMFLNKRLRTAGFVGTVISPIFGIVSLITTGHLAEQYAWASLLFWMFTQVSAYFVAFSNPRKIETRREKVLAAFCGLMVAIPGGIAGYTLLQVEGGDGTTLYVGWAALLYSCLFTVTLPIFCVNMARRYNTLSNDQLHRFVVMGLLKGSPSLLGPLLYICAAASRCIMDSNADLHVIDQCGNPILPTFCLTVFLFWTWFITVLVPPIWHREMITWSDIARWSLASDTSREGVAYGGMCFTALLLFATLYEDGSSASWLVVGLMCLFFFFTGGLLFLVTVDSYVIPMIYGTKESRNVRTDSSAGVFGHMVGDGSSKNLDSGAGDDKFDLEIGELVL